MSKEENQEKKPWYEDASTAPIAGSPFLPIGNGFEYYLKFEDINSPEQDQEVEKQDLQGRTIKKYWYKVVLAGVRVANKTLVDALQYEYPEKVERIKALKAKEEYILELPKTARRDLGIFILKSKLKSGEAFSMMRTGKGGRTRYVFKRLSE